MPDLTEHDDAPSKSELKRQMTSLQELGEELTRLNKKQLAQIPIEDEQLLEAIAEVQKIRSNSARRRHLQFIGKLMRSLDAEPIRAALSNLDQAKRKADSDFHRLEKLRDDMLAAGVTGTELATRIWPQADRQQLRQLLLQHQRELQLNKPPAASRKLFRYLRDLQELYGESA